MFGASPEFVALPVSRRRKKATLRFSTEHEVGTVGELCPAHVPPSASAKWARRRQVAFILALGLAHGGCNILLDLDRPQCKTTKQCRSLGGIFEQGICSEGYCQPECVEDLECGGAQMCVEGACEPVAAWQCLFEEPPPVESGTVTITVPISTLTSDGPLEGATVKACRKVDTECEAPVAEVVSGNAGLRFTLPANFNGYLQVEEEGYSPMMFFLPSPLRDNEELPTLTLLQANLVLGLAKAVGGTSAELDQTRGQLLLTAHNCSGEKSARVQFKVPDLDDKTVVYYTEDSVPSQDLSATTASGSGGFMNIEAGVHTISFVPASDDEEEESDFAYGTETVLVRAGWVTNARLAPGGFGQ